MIGRALLAWLALIAVESVHGVLRNLFLVPVVGDLRARQIGVVIGSALVLGTALVFIRWIRPTSVRATLWIGVLWLVLTLAFEFSLGRVLGRSWDQLLADYDLTRGGYLSLGMVLLILAPWIASKLRASSRS
jgi:hypothetical protein